MNVLFIYAAPNQKKHIRYGFSLNIAYAASILKEQNHFCSFLDLSCNDITIEGLVNKICVDKIDVVAVEFDSFALKRSDNSSSGRNILEMTKKYTKAYTIAFGFECIMEKKEKTYADITILDDIIYCIESAINSLSEGKKDYCIRNYEYDSLPLPDRKLIESEKYYGDNNIATLVQTSKGCLNTCTFCQRQGWQNYHVEHSIDYVKSEFEYLSLNGYKNIWITDENFTFNLVRAKKILQMLIETQLTKNMKIAISSWSRIDKEFLELSRRAGISVISMGIESANKEVLDFYKKHINLSEVKELITYANRLGIFTVGNFIIGAPIENVYMINKTFSYIDEVGFDQVNIKILDYMIGSDLYESLLIKDENHYFSCKENGLGLLSMNELLELKNTFIEQYIRKNNDRLKNKIQEFGPPYYSMN